MDIKCLLSCPQNDFIFTGDLSKTDKWLLSQISEYCSFLIFSGGGRGGCTQAICTLSESQGPTHSFSIGCQYCLIARLAYCSSGSSVLSPQIVTTSI